MPDDVKLMTLADLERCEQVARRGIEINPPFDDRIDMWKEKLRMAATIRRLAEFPREIVAHAEYLHEVGLSGIVADATIMLAELEKPNAE